MKMYNRLLNALNLCESGLDFEYIKLTVLDMEQYHFINQKEYDEMMYLINKLYYDDELGRLVKQGGTK